MQRIKAKDYLQMRSKQKSKYNNKKTIVDCHTFDSILEADYYRQLKLLEKANEILFFRLQPKYRLQEPFEKEDVKYRGIDYIADFEIHHLDGSIEVVDTKAVRTDVFRIKEKMFHKRYPHKLTVKTREDI